MLTQPPCAQEAEELESSGAKFVRDRWNRGEGDTNAGYGITAVLEGGDLLEKVPNRQVHLRISSGL